MTPSLDSGRCNSEVASLTASLSYQLRVPAQYSSYSFTDGLAGSSLIEDEARGGVDLETVEVPLWGSAQVDARDGHAQLARHREAGGHHVGWYLDRTSR